MFKIVKIFCFLLLFTSCITESGKYFGVDLNYGIFFNELYNYVNNNFVSPFENNENHFFYGSGFGIKENPYNQGEFIFQDFVIINCNTDENIYSMMDGVIKEVDYNVFSWTIVIKNNDMEIYYFLVKPANIKKGDLIRKGELIGNAHVQYPGQQDGHSLLLKIKYKKYFYDPYILLSNIIENK